MDNTLKIIAGFFAVLVVVTTVLAFALYSVEQSAFDAELYIRALEAENIYQRLPDLTAQMLALAAQRPEGGTILSLFRNLSEEEWSGFVSAIFPSDLLRVTAEDVVTQLVDFLNGERDNIVLSLSSIKAHLSSPEGIDAVYGLLKSQPDCTVEQLTAMATGQTSIVLCNPPESILFLDLRPIYEGQIKSAVTVIPEQVTLFTSDESRTQKIRDLKAIRLFMRWSPLMPLLFFVLMTVLAVRSVKDWLNWWGYPLLAAGLASMTLTAASGPMASLTFQIFIASALPGSLPQEIVNLFKELTASIIGNALRPTLLGAGIMALVGLIMVTLTFLLRNRLQKRSQYVG